MTTLTRTTLWFMCVLELAALVANLLAALSRQSFMWRTLCTIRAMFALVFLPTFIAFAFELVHDRSLAKLLTEVWLVMYPAHIALVDILPAVALLSSPQTQVPLETVEVAAQKVVDHIVQNGTTE